jgi:hypothetical protein
MSCDLGRKIDYLFLKGLSLSLTHTQSVNLHSFLLLIYCLCEGERERERVVVVWLLCYLWFEAFGAMDDSHFLPLPFRLLTVPFSFGFLFPFYSGNGSTQWLPRSGTSPTHVSRKIMIHKPKAWLQVGKVDLDELKYIHFNFKLK